MRDLPEATGKTGLAQPQAREAGASPRPAGAPARLGRAERARARGLRFAEHRAEPRARPPARARRRATSRRTRHGRPPGSRPEAPTTPSSSRGCRRWAPGTCICSAGTPTERRPSCGGRRAGFGAVSRRSSRHRDRRAARQARSRRRRGGTRRPGARRRCVLRPAGRLAAPPRRRVACPTRWRRSRRARSSGRAEPDPSRLLVRPGVFSPTSTSRTLADALEIDADDTVIDVGCGSGVLAFVAAKLGAKKVYGCDLSGTGRRDGRAQRGTARAERGVRVPAGRPARSDARRARQRADRRRLRHPRRARRGHRLVPGRARRRSHGGRAAAQAPRDDR